MPEIDRNVIDRAWRSFAERVVDPMAPDIQRREMRCAFHAGAAALMSFLMTGLDVGEKCTDDDERRLAAIHDELYAFAEAVGKGEA